MVKVWYRDLKNDMNVYVCFDCLNDMFIFFNKYNINTINVYDIDYEIEFEE